MPVTQTTDPLFFQKVAQSILESAAAALRCYGIEVPDRLFVGFDRPPQDCCPELVAWVSNVRAWDGNFPDTVREGYLLCFNGIAFDVTIRIGRCYIDSDENGNGIDADILAEWAAELYKDAAALYVGWLNQWRADQITELSKCDPIAIGTMIPYNGGGCAGHEFTVTVGVL
jgi:hypothetical protein